MLVSSVADVTVVASPTSWIEGAAVAQLEATRRLPRIVRAVGLPDLHPGRGTPIGAVFFADGVVYPHLVGSDVGCGMALHATDLAPSGARLDRFAKRLDLEGPWEGDAASVLAAHGAEPSAFDAALGTVGGGNHFAELVALEEVRDARATEALGLLPGRLALLVHSGSRGLGEALLRAHVEAHGPGALVVGTDEAAAYLRAHDAASRWAEANRAVVAARLLEQLGARGERVLDVEHNTVRLREGLFLHRKGAAPHGAGPVVVPGSRGALGYLVEPVGDGAVGGYSLAHGAGRKWTRGEARARARRPGAPSAASLRRTALGGRVVCEDKDLLHEEAPAAYKPIARVVEDLVEHGLARVLATLRPVLTYKRRVRG